MWAKVLAVARTSIFRPVHMKHPNFRFFVLFLTLILPSVARSDQSVVIQFDPPNGAIFREIHSTSTSIMNPGKPETQSNGTVYRDFQVARTKTEIQFQMMAHADEKRRFSASKDNIVQHFSSDGVLADVSGYEEFHAKEAREGVIKQQEYQTAKAQCEAGTVDRVEAAIWADRVGGIYGRPLRLGETWTYPSQILSLKDKKERLFTFKVKSIDGTGSRQTVTVEGDFSETTSSDFKPPHVAGAQNLKINSVESLTWKGERIFQVSTGMLLSDKSSRITKKEQNLPNGTTNVFEQVYVRNIELRRLQ